MKVIKRDGRKVDYNSDKIVIAISNANKEVGGKDKVSRSSIEFITKYIESLNKPSMHVEEIQDIIERKLMEFGKFTLAKKYIPGPTRGSYMGTEERFGFIRDTVQIGKDKITAIETRGLWRLFNDYMGGPFVCHTYLDKEQKNVIVLEGFIYAPKFDKRNYLRHVESILYSFEWTKTENDATKE